MKKFTKIIIAVIAVIVIAVAVVATLFLTGVIGKKNPKDGFYEYLDKTTENVSGMSWSDAIAKLKQNTDKPYEGKGKISMNIEPAGALEEYAEIAELLSNIELSFESKIDTKNTNAAASVNLKYDGEDLGTIEVVGNDEEIGLKFAEIYDKYLTVSMDEVKDLMEDQGIDFDEMMNSTSDIDTDAIIELLDISDSEISRIADRYKEVLKGAIPDSNYSSEKEKITVNGKEINTTVYSVKISDKDLVKVAKKVLKSLSEDDATIDLLVKKFNKLMEIAGETTTLSKTSLSYGIEALLKSLEDVEELTGATIKISLYEYKDQTVRMAVTMDDDAIIIDSMKDGDTENGALKVKNDGKEMTILNIEQTKKGEGKYYTKLSTDLGEIDSEYAGIKFEISADTEENDSSSKSNMKIYAEVAEIGKITLNIESEVTYKSVSIDKITSSNSVSAINLSNATTMELFYGLLDYADDKMDVIKDIAVLLNVEDEVEELEEALNQLKSQVSTTTPSADEEDNDTTVDDE